MILYCIDAYLRRFRKLFMFSKKFNNRDFLAANIYPCRITNTVPLWWFQAMIDRLNLFHIGCFKF